MTENPFLQWRAAGYQDLVPVVPPDAICDPRSHVKAGRGKSPGTRKNSGLWSGLKGWNTIQAAEGLLAEWGDMGASVGLRFGQVFMLDLDIYGESRGNEVEADAIRMLGPAPLRVGMWPKRALLYRNDGTIKPQKLHFSDDDGVVNIIEIPPQGVVQGVHPKTRRPYEWRRSPGAFDELTEVSGERLIAFMEAMRAKLPNAKRTSAASEGEVGQASLRGQVDQIATVLTHLPNTAGMRWDYMVKVGYATKAALPDEPDLAFELWDQWCAKWEADGYDAEIQARRWESFKGPFRVGAGWLIGEVENHTKKAVSLASLNWRDPIEVAAEEAEAEENEEVDFFGLSTAKDGGGENVFPLLTLDEIMAREPPAFLVARHIPQVSVGFLYSTPGAGKSFLALDVALHLAYELEGWNGDALNSGDSPLVLYIAAEGSFGFRNRVKAWCKRHGLESLPKHFLMIERTIDFMSAEDIDKLLRTVTQATAGRPCLIIVDTVSRAMPGADENLQKEMTLFVRACDRLKEAFRCAVLGVHHAGKNGDMRGSTVLLGAGDFVFKLERKQGHSVGRLTCEKQKDAPDGWSEPYRFETVDIGEGQTSLVPSRAEISDAPETALTPSVAKEVLKSIEDAWGAGEPWGRTHHAKDRFFERRMIQDFGFTAEQASDILALWIQSGVIEEAIADKKSKRKGLKVCGAWEPLEGGGVFD